MYGISHMGMRFSTLHNRPGLLIQLIREVQIVWNEVPQTDTHHFVLSMPRRVQECTQLRGRQLHY